MVATKLVMGKNGETPKHVPLTLAERQELAVLAARPRPTVRDKLAAAAQAPLQSALIDMLAEDRGVSRDAMLDLLAAKVRP